MTPTGTGWVDPAALDTVEYLLRGDVASVAMQGSYLPSVLALPTDGAYGAENGRALFQTVWCRRVIWQGRLGYDLRAIAELHAPVLRYSSDEPRVVPCDGPAASAAPCVRTRTFSAWTATPGHGLKPPKSAPYTIGIWRHVRNTCGYPGL